MSQLVSEFIKSSGKGGRGLAAEDILSHDVPIR